MWKFNICGLDRCRKFLQFPKILQQTKFSDLFIIIIYLVIKVQQYAKATGQVTKNSAVAERPRDASCLSVVNFNIQRSFLLVVTAASDLLVHKILLNFVLLSPIVSGGVRPKLPGQTPLHHNLPCFLPLEGRFGSRPRLVGRIGSGVRVSISFQQKYPPGSVLGQQKTEL